MALNLGPTLYELQLANQQARTQRALQERDKSRAYEQQQVQGLIEQDRWNEEKKQGEFNRKIKLAEMGGQGAALAGQPTPQFADPVVQEHADMASFVGQGEQKKQAAAADIAKEKLSQERFLKSMGWQSQADIAEANRRAAEARQTNAFKFQAEEGNKNRSSRATLSRENRDHQDAFKVANLEKGVRAELEKYPEAKNMAEAVAANNNLQNLLESGAGDIALYNGYAKLVDPGSRAVTDADVRMGMSAQGLPDRVRVLLGMAQEGRLAGPTLRAAIQEQAHKFVMLRKQEYERRAEVLRGIISQGNLMNPDFAVPNYQFHIEQIGGGGVQDGPDDGNEDEEFQNAFGR